ncbi:MAG: lysoplasmalogenase [Cyclobacteriaceae bacterium]
MKKLTLYIFILVSVAELISVTVNMPLVNLIAKPLIMITLAGYYLTNTPKRSSLFLIAMGFCWLGDVLLMFQSQEALYFMGGLVSFLIGHVLYIITYRQMRYVKSTNELLGTQKIRYSLPIVLAGTGLVVVLYPSLGELTVPVMIYALVLTIMVLQALFRFGFTNKRSFILLFVGALFFMASDSLLAINKFLEPLPLASLSIMATYIAAQYLIVVGAIAHYSENKQ